MTKPHETVVITPIQGFKKAEQVLAALPEEVVPANVVTTTPKDSVDAVGDLLGLCPECRELFRRKVARTSNRDLLDLIRYDLWVRFQPWPHNKGCPK